MNILNGATQLPGYAVSNVGLGVTFDTINNKQNASAMAAFNKTVVDNMAPVGGASYAKELDDGKYRFVEMPTNGIGYKVAAIDVEHPGSDPKFVFENFINKQDAMEKLNAARNMPDCTWTGADSSRMIHVEDYKKGAVYEDLGE